MAHQPYNTSYLFMVASPCCGSYVRIWRCPAMYVYYVYNTEVLDSIYSMDVTSVLCLHFQDCQTYWSCMHMDVDLMSWPNMSAKTIVSSSWALPATMNSIQVHQRTCILHVHDLIHLSKVCAVCRQVCVHRRTMRSQIKSPIQTARHRPGCSKVIVSCY